MIGAKSLAKSKLRLGEIVALMVFAAVPMNRVWPSAGERDTNSAAMLLPAPGLFSTTNCWPKLALNFCARRRAGVSAEAPAPKPTMMRTGRVG